MSTFTYHQHSSDLYSHYMIIAYTAERSAYLSLDERSAYISLRYRNTADAPLCVQLTREQISHFLSLDCPDAFIAYASTLVDIPASDKIDFSLTAEEISTVLCGLQWSINHHKSLSDDCFCDAFDERKEILDRHYRLKSMFAAALETTL